MRDPRIERTYQLVGEAVRALLVAEGWDAVTHQRVAEYADLGRNTVYRHFPDRAALLSHGGNFVDADHHAPITGDVRADLDAELRNFRRELFDGIVGTIIGAIVERAERDPEALPVRDRLVTSGARQTWELVEDGQRQGLIDPGRDVADVVSALCGPLLYARLCQGRPPSDAAISAIVDSQLIADSS